MKIHGTEYQIFGLEKREPLPVRPESSGSAADVRVFLAEKLASKFCEQYGYERGSEEHAIATNAFCVGFRMKQNRVLSGKLSTYDRIKGVNMESKEQP